MWRISGETEKKRRDFPKRLLKKKGTTTDVKPREDPYYKGKKKKTRP